MGCVTYDIAGLGHFLSLCYLAWMVLGAEKSFSLNEERDGK